MKISYVLPVYNQQNNIAACLRSLVNQKVKPYEIIIINDGSTDNTPSIIDNFNYGRYKPLIIHRSGRRGAAFCRNFGNSIATGEIIAVCDCDIYYRDRSKAIKIFFEDNPDKDIFCSALHIRSCLNPGYKWDQEAYDWNGDCKCPVSHPTMAFRRKVFDKVKYHELSKDTDLFEFMLLDALSLGFEIGGCQNPLMLKIEGNSNRKVDEAKRLKIKLYRKYGLNVQEEQF